MKTIEKDRPTSHSLAMRTSPQSMILDGKASLAPRLGEEAELAGDLPGFMGNPQSLFAAYRAGSQKLLSQKRGQSLGSGWPQAAVHVFPTTFSASVILMLVILTALLSPVHARQFTDDQGRQVEAELVGVRGGSVVIASQSVRGLWPIARLSAADQEYVKQWQKTNTAVKHVTVQVTERDGIGERGEFKKAEAATPSPTVPSLPFVPPTETRASYKHYEASIANPGALDAAYLKVAYVVYVVHPDGTVGISPGVQFMESLPAGQSERVQTEGVSATRTKTKQVKVRISRDAISATEKTARSQERFGGVWVRVIGPDGQLIGESRKLTAELAKLDPPWEEAEVHEDIPELKSLGDLLEMVKKLLPPAHAEGKASPPAPPPGLPPLPR